MRTYGEVIDVRTHRHPSLRAADPRAAADALGRPATGAAPDGGAPVDGAAGVELDLDREPARPAQFVWRGRLYLVREVLAHWVELGTWWTARGGAAGSRRLAAPVPVLLADPAAPSGAGARAGGSVPGSADAASSPGPRSVAADVGAVEREVWRVEAAAGRASTPGVFDLVRDLPARAPGAPAAPDCWRLARALD